MKPGKYWKSGVYCSRVGGPRPFLSQHCKESSISEKPEGILNDIEAASDMSIGNGWRGVGRSQVELAGKAAGH